MTALGLIRLERSYALCPACRQSSFAADRLLGLDDWLTPRASSMACRAGVSDPFRKAEGLLAELAGWSVSADTLRRRCHEHAARAAERRGQGGWRDVKVVGFACRERGEAASSQDYEQRDLPAPGVRSVVAAIEEAEAFGRRVEREALRLRVPLGQGPSVLGDGAGWIWKLVEEHFFGCAAVLDVFHATEHLATAARAAFGEGEAMKGWLGEARRLLEGDRYDGACAAMALPVADEGARRRLEGAAGEVLNYFAANRERLGYAVRLRRGQAIGSGLVEGTIKQLVNLRMKRTGARWRVSHVGPFVEMLGLADSVEWSEYWASLAS